MKSNNVNHSEDRPPSSTRSSSLAKEGTGPATSSTKQQAATSNTSPSSTQPRMADSNPVSARNSESPQPADAKTAAAGSQAASKNGAGETASPYGTRSRNRNGGARPNYAEDKDIDMDLFDGYNDKKDDESRKTLTRQASFSNAAAQAVAPRSGNGSSRKPLPSDDTKHQSSTLQSSTAKDHPNAQSQLANSAPANTTTNGTTTKSKKRKAEPAATTTSGNSNQTAASSSNAHSSGAQRRGAGSHGGNGVGNANGNKAGGGARDGGYGESNLLTFENSGAKLKNGKMVADDGTVLEVNDHVYLVCEPPGEPYYLGRIMEFLHVKNDASKPIDALRINWYYRPKDIGRKVQDTRLVFATMHSDISPLTSLRGKCQIRHKAEIPDMAAYKREPDSFWYEKLYDRYIQKNYEVIPTAQIINVPEHVKRVLDERWKYILVEQGRGKELTSAVKTCKRCSGYCASNDSVDCAVCQHTYHMNCVKPPLLKKPSRGFAWSCAACSRAQERKLEARNTPNTNANHEADEEEFLDDDEDDGAACGVDTGRTSRTSPDEEHQPATAEQIYHASLWPYRYLGIHCKVEDALDYDDRIFPRASTRLGPRHQAVVLPWPGRPVEYVKPLEVKKNGRKNEKLSKETLAALEAERVKRENRPKWVQDEPPGWVQRGGDDTVTVSYKPPEDCGVQMSGEAIDDYMATARSMAVSLGLPPRSTNLQDVARDALYRSMFDPAEALKELRRTPKADFKEPELTPAEQKKFEEGVAKFGSELHSVMKHVKTLSPATVTRYYYTWKKTERGKQVWGNYSGRKGKKDAKKAEAAANKMADDVADDHDDSAFDTDKARDKKKGFMCKFCSTKHSRQWRRAPNASATLVTENGGRNSNKDKNGQYIQALCRRCAELWRRYAIQWEDVDEVAKKVAQTGGRGWRRRVDEELYKELLAADEMMNNTRFSTPDPVVSASPAGSQLAGQEPPRKKLKGYAEKDPDLTTSEAGSVTGVPASKKKEKVAEKPQPPPAPEIPKPRTLPCAICREMEPLGDQHLSCKECRLTVHRNCYGIIDNRAPGKWTCDMCLNDKSPQVSIHYKCVLCPVEYTEHDFVEPPKISHKKKTERDRERERQERETAREVADYYRKKQEEMNRPVNPREPLKRTADNNWVHVTCAVWTPEIKFGNAKALGPSEGVPLVPRARYAETCKVCKTDGGACASCHQCRATVHVECAHQAGYTLGFDITPVKGSRREQFNIVSLNGESGTMTAAVWCKDHAPKTAVHLMNEIVDESGMNALQLYVQNYKQADLTLTGCARKANQITVASKMSTTSSPPLANRRVSTTTMVNGGHWSDDAPQSDEKICLTCNSDTSPKWYPIDRDQESKLVNGHHGSLGSEAQKFVDQRCFQCHKCKKAGRQLVPPVQPKEPTPPADPPRQVSQPPVAVSNQLVGPPELRPASRPYAWSPPQSVGAPLAVQPAPLQAPIVPLQAPLIPPTVQGPPPAAPPPPALPPTIAPRGASMQAPQYGPANRQPYNEWHRSSSSHGPPPLHPGRDMNGGPSPPPPPSAMPPLAPPNHLRPPPLSMTHGPPPTQNGHNSHIAQPPPYVNGQMPPSPRRHSGPSTLTNGVPYMSPHPSHHHGPPDLRSHPHHMAMNQIPPVVPGPAAPELQQPPNFLRPMLHHPPPHHASAPALRDSLSMAREQSNPPPPRENRASAASASPSLRNLLS